MGILIAFVAFCFNGDCPIICFCVDEEAECGVVLAEVEILDPDADLLCSDWEVAEPDTESGKECFDPIFQVGSDILVFEGGGPGSS
jgi:hypothetical protein